MLNRSIGRVRVVHNNLFEVDILSPQTPGEKELENSIGVKIREESYSPPVPDGQGNWNINRFLNYCFLSLTGVGFIGNVPLGVIFVHIQVVVQLNRLIS